MKKILLLLFLIYINKLSAQQLKVESIYDWNKIRFSGFIEGTRESCLNPPANHLWYWGININHPNTGHGGQIAFAANWDEIGIPLMYIRSTASNGAATWAKVIHSKGDHAIEGKLTAKEIEIKINTGADHVFYHSYNLMPLSEVETFVKENKHLPEIPSEKQMQEDGLNINDMQIKLLQKIEELTLYVIEQDKRIKALEEENHTLKSH